MKVGKLTSSQLKSCVLDRIRVKRPETIVGAALGEDCAVLKPDGLVFLTTDPITGAISGNNNIGALAVNVACNDIASSGARPIALLLTIMLPPECDTEDVADIMLQAEQEAKKLSVDIVGGHTEFTNAVNRIIISATAVGQGDKPIRSDCVRAGDEIIVTKTLGIEGTSIIANDYAERLENLTKRELHEARDMIRDISVVKEGLIAREMNISCMHDITEGGIFGAVAEICKCNNLGVDLYPERIPLHPLTRKICDELHINAYRLLSSGSMLIASADAENVRAALERAGIQASIVGRFTEKDLRLIDAKGVHAFDMELDEINKL